MQSLAGQGRPSIGRNTQAPAEKVQFKPGNDTVKARNIVGNLMMISSDGHTTARMEDYRSYLDEEFRPDFDEFLVEYRTKGSRNFDPRPCRREGIPAPRPRGCQSGKASPQPLASGLLQRRP